MKKILFLFFTSAWLGTSVMDLRYEILREKDSLSGKMNASSFQNQAFQERYFVIMNREKAIGSLFSLYTIGEQTSFYLDLLLNCEFQGTPYTFTICLNAYAGTSKWVEHFFLTVGSKTASSSRELLHCSGQWLNEKLIVRIHTLSLNEQPVEVPMKGFYLFNPIYIFDSVSKRESFFSSEGLDRIRWDNPITHQSFHFTPSDHVKKINGIGAKGYGCEIGKQRMLIYLSKEGEWMGLSCDEFEILQTENKVSASSYLKIQSEWINHFFQQNALVRNLIGKNELS
ncbi:MAG: hypothetical protein JW774_01090 [Candidatus Aureabacteria bacterium]|nr:hypothetical protein [Candidatus Auribacterota bacterium]